MRTPRGVRPTTKTERATERVEDYFVGRFSAMGGPCTVLVDSDDRDEAEALVAIAAHEACRIERKFSRYRTDNPIHEINHAAGEAVEVDDETAHLIDYAVTCWELSEGRFDITSGVLRRRLALRRWRRGADPHGGVECLQWVGWGKVSWRESRSPCPPGWRSTSAASARSTRSIAPPG